MMKVIKKIFSVCCASLLMLSFLAGCGQPSGSTASNGSSSEAVDVSIDDILAAVKEAYGENYLPDTEMPEEMLAAEFPIDSSLVEEMKAECSMIGFHPDRVVIIKAREGKGGEVKKLLEQIKEDKIENEIQYPANLAKVMSAQVVQQGDYAAFLLVGAVDENMDASQEEAVKFAQKEVQKAVDAFYLMFE